MSSVGFVQFSYGTVILGAGSVVGALLDAGHDVTFFNLNNAVGYNIIERTLQEVKVRKAVRVLLAAQCEVYFFSALTMDIPFVIDIIRKIKKHTNRPCVVGGVHPTITGATVLDDNPEIDYIVVGEGELAVVEIVEHINAPDMLEKVQNLGYRNADGRAIVNPIRPPRDLSKLPAFPWHLYPRKFVVDPSGFLYVRATRGCPYKCTFCCNSAFLNLYGRGYIRKRPIKNVIDEMVYLKEKFSPKIFCFADEMLVWDKAYSIELFRQIKEKVGMPFGFMARVEYINDEIISAAAESGCCYIGMGVECGDEKFRRDVLNRHNSNEQIIKAFSLCREHGISTASFNMIGYPCHSDEELTRATVELNKTLQPDQVQVTIFYPFAGTTLHDYCVKHDLIDPEKQRKARNVYDDSILRGVSLTQTRDSLAKMLNKA